MFPAVGLILAWLSTVLYPALITTFGQHGTSLSMVIALIGVLFVRHDFNQIVFLWQQFPAIFWKESFQADQTIKKITLWSQIARQKGRLALESQLEAEHDHYINMGLQYIIDEVDELKLTHGLRVVSQARQQDGQQLIALCHFLGRSALGIGVCFSLFGVYSLIQSDDHSFSTLSILSPILISIGYGVGLKVLFFYPLASRLEVKLRLRQRYDDMVHDGLVSIVRQENSKVIAHRLQEYFNK